MREWHREVSSITLSTSLLNPFHHSNNLPTLLFIRNLVPGMPAQARHPSNTRQHARANSHDVTLGPESKGENPSTRKGGKDTSRKRKPLLPLGEVIEISSDEESLASIPNAMVTDLRQQVKRLKEVIHSRYQFIRTLIPGCP
jgi:hypothetical protein